MTGGGVLEAHLTVMFLNPPAPWPSQEGPKPSLCAEDERLQVLGSYGLDDISAEGDEELHRIARLASRLCKTPIALVSIVEEHRQRFAGRTGLDETETPRSVSFCAHAMLEKHTMVVTDASFDPRFKDNHLVTGPPHVRFYAGAPLVSAEGAPLGALCVIDTEPRPEGLSDLQLEGLELLAEGVMRRLEARRASRDNQQKFRLLADNMPDMAYSCDTDLRFDFYNKRWDEFTGQAGPEDSEGWRPLIHPDDADDAFGKWAQALEENRGFESEFRMLRKDGEWRWVISRALPMVDSDGKISRWFGTVTDIDETRDLSDARDLLAKELSHRIKNIFAVVGGLVSIKARQRPEAAEFAADLAGTIKALGLAHDYVRPVEGRQGESLQHLLGDLVAPYQNDARDRIVIEGDDSAIGTRAATPLALVFHELATNSAKYGALSCEEGRIEIRTRRNAEAQQIEISWREFALPCDDPGSASEGFGSRMLRMAIEGQLGGSFSRDFGKDGLVVELSIPVSSLEG